MAVLSSGVPAGTIYAFAGSVAPRGYLLCDGSALLITQYRALYNAILTSFDPLVSSGYFRIPDTRTYFIRVRDGGAGLDPDRGWRTYLNGNYYYGDNVGSLQPQATKLPNSPFVGDLSWQHSHNTILSASPFVASGTGWEVLDADTTGSTDTAYYYTDNTSTSWDGRHGHGLTGWDSETRPYNVSFNFIIKY
jgi:phage-related tail fiber protein